MLVLDSREACAPAMSGCSAKELVERLDMERVAFFFGAGSYCHVTEE